MIQRLQFSVDIKASKTKIWDVLWSDHGYRDWAGVFFEGSYIVAEHWTEGSKVQFLGPDQNGIYSVIEKYIPNNIIQFKHMGSVLQGEEQPIDDETRLWSGATETYRLEEGSDKYKLSIDIDVMDEHLEFMNNTFPKALEKIKNNCEQQTKEN